MFLLLSLFSKDLEVPRSVCGALRISEWTTSGCFATHLAVLDIFVVFDELLSGVMATTGRQSKRKRILRKKGIHIETSIVQEATQGAISSVTRYAE